MLDGPPEKAGQALNKLAMTALRLAAARKAQRVDEAVLLDATAAAFL